MQLAALSCELYVMQYFISIIHSHSATDYRLHILYWTRWNQAAEIWKMGKKTKKCHIEGECKKKDSLIPDGMIE